MRLLMAVVVTVGTVLTVPIHACAYEPADTVRTVSERRCPLVAVKTDLLHDALLTPDLGLELTIGKRFSVSVEAVYAWWSHNSKHRYWRLRGGWIEGRMWLGEQAGRRALSGHHLGVYGSLLNYDFEFGGNGVQSPKGSYGGGVSYGYSFPLNERLNLDVSLRVGYSGGKVIKYKPECGTYVCTDRYFFRYVGPTALEVTLVWFPGRGPRNNPEAGL